MVEGGDHCCHGSHGCYQYWFFHFSGKCKQVTKTVWTLDLEEIPDSRERKRALDLEEPPDSRERTEAPVLWLSCDGQTDVWELFSHNSCFSAILDRQGLLVAAPVDLSTKKAESFSPTGTARLLVKKSK